MELEPDVAGRARRRPRRRPGRRLGGEQAADAARAGRCSTAPATSSPGTARPGAAATASRTGGSTTRRAWSPARARGRRCTGGARSRRSAASTSASSPTSRTPTGGFAHSSRAGGACGCRPRSRYHLGGATSRRMGDLETELIARNTLALVLKSFPAARLLAWSPLILGYQAYTLARAVARAARGARCCAGGRARSTTCRAPCERAERSRPNPRPARARRGDDGLHPPLTPRMSSRPAVSGSR